MRDTVALPPQLRRERAHALGRPTQRRLRITARLIVQQPLQIRKQRRIRRGQWLAATAPAAHPPRLQRLARSKLTQTRTGGLKKGLRGRFGVYLPPLLEALGLAEVTHEARNNEMRAL